MSRLTIGQIGQLIEIDRAGVGIGDHVQELIARLTSGGVAGKMTDTRLTQAKCLWDRGFGCDPSVKVESFGVYLAGIPEIPESLVADDTKLPFLSLCDPRPGMLRACQLLGIQHEELGYHEESSEPFDDRFTLPTAPFWIRHDDGRKNRNRRPDHCRDELVGDVIAGTAMEGIFAYAHHTDIIKEGEYTIDLPRTVHRDDRVGCAYLGVWHGRVELRLCRGSGFAGPDFGALLLRRK